MKIRLLSILLFCAFILQAQNNDYTYQTDRKFITMESMLGYDFKPNVKETIDGTTTKLKPGQYSFGFAGNYLYADGGNDVKGVYSVNNVQPAKYGWKMTLMNSRDARIQGHLKVILNDYGNAEALVFKRTGKEQEIIFHLPNLPKTRKEQEDAYFTDMGEFELEVMDSLWNNSFQPFTRIQDTQYRFLISDSTSLAFVEEYDVIDKRKKPKPVKESSAKESKEKKEKKPKKKKDKKKKDEDENDEEWYEEEEESGKTNIWGDEIEEEDKPEEEEEEEIEETEQDSKPTFISLEGMSKEELEEMAEADPKIKLEKAYFIVLNTFYESKEGETKRLEKRYRIKKYSELEDESAKRGEERFQIDFIVDGNKHIYMYLLDDRTVSSIEMENSRYLMRGQ